MKITEVTSVKYPYASIKADNNKILIEIGNMYSYGTEISSGYEYYDRKTGEKLTSPKKLEAGNIMEVWDYDSDKISTNQVFNAGEYILKAGIIYKVLLTHYKYQVTDGNFSTLYIPVTNLDDVLSGSIPEWIQPHGAHDAYQKGSKVTYNGKTYVSTADNNVWVPGVYGWDLIK